MKYYLKAVKYVLNGKDELVPMCKYERTFSSYAEMLETKVDLSDQGFKTSWTTLPQYELDDEVINS